MTLSLAPMEGITTHVFRRALATHFGGVDIFFTPFIAAAHTNARERRDLLPDNNPGMRLIPQMLTDSVSDLVSLARELKEMGYTELNLNLGCPSNTVVKGGRGSGFLARPDALRAFLDGAFSASPLPLSAKTRIGLRDASEWEALLHMYSEFPFTSLTVHPRTGIMMYSGKADPSYARMAAEMLPYPVIYNGDIVTPADYERFAAANAECPAESRFTGCMIGRGLITDPSLASRIRTHREHAGSGNTGGILRDPRFPAFHAALFSGYAAEELPRRKHLDKMKELWTFFLAQSPVPPEKKRAIFSAMDYPSYEEAVKNLLKTYKTE